MNHAVKVCLQCARLGANGVICAGILSLVIPRYARDDGDWALHFNILNHVIWAQSSEVATGPIFIEKAVKFKNNIKISLYLKL